MATNCICKLSGPEVKVFKLNLYHLLQKFVQIKTLLFYKFLFAEFSLQYIEAGEKNMKDQIDFLFCSYFENTNFDMIFMYFNNTRLLILVLSEIFCKFVYP